MASFRACEPHAVLFSLVVGGLLASLLWLLWPTAYLVLADALAWRMGRPSVAQGRLETSLVQLQLRTDAMQDAPGVVWFGDSHLKGLPPSFITGAVNNFAIGGETAVRLAQRIGRYGSAQRASRVVLMSGRNDLQMGIGLSASSDAFATMLSAIPARVPVTLVSVPPAREAGDRIARRKALDQRIQAQCALHANCRFVALEALADTSGQLLEKYDVGDGIHLNAAGYRVLAGLLQH